MPKGCTGPLGGEDRRRPARPRQATFTPHLDTGDFVIVINADKVRVTGNKETDKEYQRYSGYRGGLKRIPLAEMREQHPDRLILSAVKGMLPKTNWVPPCSPSSRYTPAANTRTLFKNPNPDFELRWLSTKKLANS